MLCRARRQRLNGLLVANVGHNRDGRGAGALALFDHLGQRLLAARREHEARALPREMVGRGAPDATRGAGDHHGTVGQVTCHGQAIPAARAHNRARPACWRLVRGTGSAMATARVQDVEPFAGHSPDQERPLGGYAVLMGAFVAAVGAFSAWFRASGRELPQRVGPGDVALMSVATHKASRLIAKDRVTSTARAPFTRFQGDAGPAEVDEAARGRGLRRAVGELIICPYCLGLWIAAGFAAGLIVAPSPTRWVASVLSAVFGADVLQIAYAKAEDSL